MKTLEERFESKVDRSPGYGPQGDCHKWTASTIGGYGAIGSGGRKGAVLYAHRVAWELVYGKIPTGIHVLHRCDNPSCVNIAHLFCGSHQDNMTDKVVKGRHGRAKLTENIVSECRDRYKAGETQTALALEFGVSTAAMSHAVNGIHWKHVS